MNEQNAMDRMGGGAGGVTAPGNVDLQLPQADAADGELFRANLDHWLAAGNSQESAAPKSESLGRIASDRVLGLASEFQKDQQYVSNLLEKATRTGDSMHLMRAMLALNDYQIRVQTMSKTVTKFAGAVDQLTKMQ